MLASIVFAAIATASPAAAATVESSSATNSIVERGATDGCPDRVRFCFGLDIHVVTVDGQEVATAKWLDSQIATANRHFAAIDVGFEIAQTGTAPHSYAHVATREQRDALGTVAQHHDHAPTKHIPVFLVSRLEDVDAPGEQIRGVHWRRRQNVAQRWIILSTIAQPMVLAHELGHYFGLSHSTYAVSIMNKRPRRHPPAAERTFAPPEVTRLRKGREQIVRSGALLNYATANAI